MQKMISLDWDDTLYNLKAVNEQFLMDEYGIHDGYKTVTSFESLGLNYPSIINKVWNNPERYSRGNLLDGAIEFYEELVSMVGETNIQIVTASMPNIIDVKNQMIKDRFKIGCDVVHSIGPKSHYTKGSILIDDHIDNIISHMRINNNMGVLFNYHRLPYIRDRANAIDDYFERYKDVYSFVYKQFKK